MHYVNKDYLAKPQVYNLSKNSVLRKFYKIKLYIGVVNLLISAAIIFTVFMGVI
jgi:hypothetical protein